MKPRKIKTKTRGILIRLPTRLFNQANSKRVKHGLTWNYIFTSYVQSWMDLSSADSPESIEGMQPGAPVARSLDEAIARGFSVGHLREMHVRMKREIKNYFRARLKDCLPPNGYDEEKTLDELIEEILK